MTSRSSIFSFNTLKLPRTFPAATVFALAIVGLCELGARALVSRGTIEVDMSLRKTLDQRINRIEKESPQIWILGNSTLDYGINESELAKRLGTPVIKLAHGSATINASAAMLDFYNKQTGKKPQQVIVTLTKDDLNPNGFRAKQSQRYFELDQTQVLPETDKLMLRRARENIRGLLHIGTLSMDPKQRAAAFSKDVKPYDGKPLTEKSKLERDLVNEYVVAGDWFKELRTTSDKLGLPAPIIVIMPTTDQYKLFHDKFVSAPKYDDAHAQIIAAIHAAGLTVIDKWPARTDYNRFRDPYHLRPDGQEWFTKRLAEELSPLLSPTTLPTTNP